MSSSLSTRPQITSNLDLNINPHTQTITQTLAQLETDDRTGLTERQIIDRQQKFGANELVGLSPT